MPAPRGITHSIAEFIADTPRDAVPADALEVAKRASIDTIGVALAASREAIGQVVADYVRAAGGRPEAGVIGWGFQTSAQDAAFANGVMAHALEYDDTHPDVVGHPSAVLVPTAFAVGQALDSSGAEALDAYVIGFEVVYRIGREAGRYLARRGYHAVATWAPIGAAAVAARLLKLDQGQTRMALGIAVSEAAGVLGNVGTMTKPFHIGNGARGGVTAALLAQRGFTAAPDILERRNGFLHTLAGQHEVDSAAFTRGLGTEFALSSGLDVKPHASCGKSHDAINALLHLVTTYDIRPDDVTDVVCCTGASTPRDILVFSRPATAQQARFSMEYCLATALIDRKVGLPQFTEEALRRPLAQEMLRRVRYSFWSEPSDRGAAIRTDRVTVRLKDGRELSHQMERRPGNFRSPSTLAMVMDKYRECASRALNGDAVERSLALLQQLDSLSQLHDLMRVVGKVSSTDTEAPRLK